MSAMPPHGSFEKEFGYVQRNCLEPRHEMRRAVDLIPPAETSDSINYRKIRDIGLSSLVNEIENAKLTGCLKISNKAMRSRGGLLLWKGLIFGVIFGCKKDPMPKANADSMQDIVAQMKHPESSAMKFPLEENMVVPSTALFLGYPVERTDDFSALEYLDYILGWFSNKKATGTLAISISGRYPATTLGFIYEGKFSSYFDVDSVAVKTDLQMLRNVLKDAPKAVLEISILAPDFFTSVVEPGIKLSTFF